VAFLNMKLVPTHVQWITHSEKCGIPDQTGRSTPQ
jgi:hypothetical protein